jgi:hypothetical protein
MGGAAKGVSAICTILLMYLAFDLLMKYVNTVEYGLQQMAGSVWAFFTGVVPTDPQMTMTMLIVILGVVSIAGALKG